MSDQRPPWHEGHWQWFQQARRDHRLPHALLIKGAEYTGKNIFAREMAAALLCQQPTADGDACGLCQACHLVQAGTHPELTLITPEEKAKTIKVDAIRRMIDRSVLTSGSNFSVFIITPAESLHRAGMNALLKTLEEPSPNTVILLVSHSPDRLPATIISRCQSIHLKVSLEQAESYLSQKIPQDERHRLLSRYWNTPLKAVAEGSLEEIELSESLLTDLMALSRGSKDPVSVASNWEGRAIEGVLHLFILWILDLIRVGASRDDNRLYSPWQASNLHLLSEQIDLRQLHEYLDLLYEKKRQLTHNPNPQMLLEYLMMQWQTISTRG